MRSDWKDSSMSEPTDLSTVELPLLPLRDVVVFPHMVIPLFVGRVKSIKVAQKAASKDEPSADDLFEIGSISTILQMLKLPDGTVKVLVEGQQRAKLLKVQDLESHFMAQCEPLEVKAGADSNKQESEVEALRRAVSQQFEQYVKLNKKICMTYIRDPDLNCRH